MTAPRGKPAFGLDHTTVDGRRVVVTEGLRPGDRVVTSGQLRLHNGAAVAVSPDDTVALDGAPRAVAQAR